MYLRRTYLLTSYIFKYFVHMYFVHINVLCMYVLTLYICMYFVHRYLLCHIYLHFILFLYCISGLADFLVFFLLAFSGQAHLENQRISVQRTKEKNSGIAFSGPEKKLALPTFENLAFTFYHALQVQVRDLCNSLIIYPRTLQYAQLDSWTSRNGTREKVPHWPLLLTPPQATQAESRASIPIFM